MLVKQIERRRRDDFIPISLPHKVPFVKLIARINNLNRHYIQYLFIFNWRKSQLLKAKFTRNHRIRTWSISQVVLLIAVSRSQLIQTGPNEIFFPRLTSLSLSYGGDPFKRWFHFCPLPPPPQFVYRSSKASYNHQRTSCISVVRHVYENFAHRQVIVCVYV